jgi:hypothetical protein
MHRQAITALALFSFSICAPLRAALPTPTGYWTLDSADISGATALDKSGNNMSGALANTTSVTGTTIAMSVRTGNTAAPDATWTAFNAVASSGGAIAGTARYVQYRAVLTTADATRTAALNDVTLSYAP